MNQFIVRYLGNVRWWGGGMVERRRRRGRLIADRVQRARTPRDLEIARRQRVRRIVGKGTHREWSAVLPGVQYIPRPMFPSIRPGWRLASGMIVLLCAMLLLVTIVDTIYYVESIELAGAVLVFLVTMKELPATLILGPMGFKTLSTVVWSASSEAFFAQAAVPALLLIMLSSIPMAFLMSRDVRVNW